MPAPQTASPPPAGSRAAFGTWVFRARQKGSGFPHLSASSRRQPCLGFCEPGAGSPGPGQGWRERSVRRRARRCGSTSGAQRSAPPARLAAELGISCLLFSLYVVSSHQEEFSFLPPHTTFLPPTPPKASGSLPIELAQRRDVQIKPNLPPQGSSCSPRRAQQTLKGHLPAHN